MSQITTVTHILNPTQISDPNPDSTKGLPIIFTRIQAQKPITQRNPKFILLYTFPPKPSSFINGVRILNLNIFYRRLPEGGATHSHSDQTGQSRKHPRQKRVSYSLCESGSCKEGREEVREGRASQVYGA